MENKIENKRILKEIAKRWCKGILNACEASVSFHETGLTEDEMSYIGDEVQKILNKITDKPINNDVNNLVKEYFEFD